MPFDTELKQQAILKAALELYAEQGFHDAPMARLAAKARVGVGTVYRYFTDKSGVIEALYHDVDEALQAAITRGMDPALSARQQFLQLVSNMIHFLQGHPQEFKFLEQYYHSPFGIDKKRQMLLLEKRPGRKNHLMELFFKGNNPAVKALPAPVLLSLAFGPVLFLLRDATAGLVELNEQVTAQVAEGCWDAIKNRPEALQA